MRNMQQIHSCTPYTDKLNSNKNDRCPDVLMCALRIQILSNGMIINYLCFEIRDRAVM